MTEDIRANIGMAFFALLVLGSMVAVIIWDTNTATGTKATEPEEHSVLKCVVTPLREPPANCLPPVPDDDITPEIPCEPESVEPEPGIEYDAIPSEFIIR